MTLIRLPFLLILSFFVAALSFGSQLLRADAPEASEFSHDPEISVNEGDLKRVAPELAERPRRQLSTANGIKINSYPTVSESLAGVPSSQVDAERPGVRPGRVWSSSGAVAVSTLSPAPGAPGNVSGGVDLPTGTGQDISVRELDIVVLPPGRGRR